MGCTFSTAYNTTNEVNESEANVSAQPGSASFPQLGSASFPQPGSACYPVPFGHIPYTPALPGAMGPLWNFPIEWWYYGGWAWGTDTTGTPRAFTILMQTIRLSQDTQNTAAAILYGIGSETSNFFTNSVYGIGNFPYASSTSWSTSFTDDAKSTTMTCELTSNKMLGLCGATYQLNMSTTGIAVSLTLEDQLGMVMEGTSGAFHGKTENSFEYAIPTLAIKSGTITMKGVKTTLSGGNLWLDRQTISSGQGDAHVLSPRSLVSAAAAKPLYTGNWLVVHMNDGTVYNLVFFWPQQKEQWIVGSELQPPVNPLGKIGLEYPPLPSSWGGQNCPPTNGVNILGQDDFDLNILNPSNPYDSPNWKSPKSDHTYSSAWKLKIKDQTYKMTAWVPGSEVHLGTFFFEGAASIAKIDEDAEIEGYAFVELMGYN